MYLCCRPPLPSCSFLLRTLSLYLYALLVTSCCSQEEPYRTRLICKRGLPLPSTQENLGGSLNCSVSFEKEPSFCRTLLQKTCEFLGSLLTLTQNMAIVEPLLWKRAIVSLWKTAVVCQSRVAFAQRTLCRFHEETFSFPQSHLSLWSLFHKEAWQSKQPTRHGLTIEAAYTSAYTSGVTSGGFG